MATCPPCHREPAVRSLRTPRVHVVNVRLSEAEIQLVRAAADRYDLPMGSWARERLLAAARKALKD